MIKASPSEKGKTNQKKVPYDLPLCKICGKHNVYRIGWRVDGVTPKFRSKCDHCNGRAIKHRERKKGIKNPNFEYVKKVHCEKCGFEAENQCQLDVDHVDGNNQNNDESNLQTLCANCHRLKTYLNRDWENKEEPEV